MRKLIIFCLLLCSCPLAVADARFKINEYLYEVPDRYRPVVNGSEFTFYLDFPNSGLNLQKVGPNPENRLRIRVRHKLFRAPYTIKDIKHNGKLIQREHEFDVYKTHIGKNGQTEVTSYLTTINSDPVVMSQPGELNISVYRSAGINRELDYVYSKEITLQEWVQLDKYIMEILQSFKSPLSSPLNIKR